MLLLLDAGLGDDLTPAFALEQHPLLQLIGRSGADLEPQLKALLRAFDAGRTVRAFTAVDRALAAIDRNASPKIVADWLALQL